jgi:putative acetyltransferase
VTDVSVHKESPLTDEGIALINGSEDALREVYPPEECFTFTAEELVDDKISFFVARKNADAKGCIALVDEGSYGEIKRLYVPDHSRGLGVAKILMSHLEAQSKAMGHQSVKLETGEKLAAAVVLYKSLGYSVCGPFGDYEDHPASLFMEKAL